MGTQTLQTAFRVRVLCCAEGGSVQADLAAEKEARALRDDELARTRAELAEEQAVTAAAAAEAAQSLAAMREALSDAEKRLVAAEERNAALEAEAGQVKQQYLEVQDSVEAEQSSVMRMKVCRAAARERWRARA